jgi:hypothetical protein
MKTQIRLSIVAITAFAASFASAQSLYQVGDTSVHFIGKAGIVYEDNVYLQSSNEVSDFRMEFTAGLEFKLAPDRASTTTLVLENKNVLYDSEDLDENFFNVRFNSKYDSGVVLSEFHASYKEDYTSRFDLDATSDTFGVLVLRDTTKAGGSVKYGISQLTSVKAAFDFDDVSYEDIMVNGEPFTIYDDRESYTIPVTLFYKVRPKVDLTAGVRYRNTETESNIEYTDLYYYVGAVGELFSPVIYADLTVGYQERDAKGNAADSDSASYKFSLIYTGDPKGTAYFTLARDYRTSAVNSSTYAFTSAAIGGNYAVSDTIGVNAAIVYGESVYEESAREDDIRMVRLGASYQPNDYFTVDASYYRRDVDGNTADYVNNEFRVTASLRY